MADSKSMWKQYDDDLNNESNPVDNTVLNGGHPMGIGVNLSKILGGLIAFLLPLPFPPVPEFFYMQII